MLDISCLMGLLGGATSTMSGIVEEHFWLSYLVMVGGNMLGEA